MLQKIDEYLLSLNLDTILIAKIEWLEKLYYRVSLFVVERELESLHKKSGIPETSQQLPRSAKFLLLLIPHRYREGMIGDLEEEFQTILVPEYGLRSAKFYYWWHVILACLNSLQGLAITLTRLLRSQ